MGSRAAHRRAFALAWPLILANVTVPLVGAVDTAVLGHLPDARYLGAAALGGVLFSLLYYSFGFLRTGTTGPVAQARGAGDFAEVKATLYRALLIASVVGVTIVALQLPIRWIAFQILKASPEIMGAAETYVAVRIWGAPAVLTNFVLLGWYLGLENARIGLLLQVVINLANLALNLFFVFGLGMTIEGVAAATAIAEWIGAALGLLIALRTIAGMTGTVDRARLFDRARVLRLIALNRDIFIRTVLVILCFSSFTAIGARFGDLTVAANAVLMTFSTFMAFALDGFAQAAETLVGRAIGAGDRTELDDCLGATFVWSAAVAMGFTLVYGTGGPFIIAMLTDLPAVRTEALRYLPWAAIMPMVAVWSFQLDGVFWGAARGPDMRNMMLISAGCFVLAAWIAVPRLGNDGLWLAIYVFLIARAVTLGLKLPAVLRSVG
ncbi:MAG: MATE family efflux transporter [Alphaproteobacteria bacterium]|nr:MATE family efflux transporter [Alphaproteobacteria bacterium]